MKMIVSPVIPESGLIPMDTNSCGDVAKHGGDKGDKFIKATGYIFVQ